jgi:NitT/TauT family transport system ATP-binding protein
MAKVGLKDFENHFPKQLSGGMQQRTALARALANNPRILLMDEPFGALDHQTRELMQELLQGIWEAERKTVLFVTHDIDEAIFMGSRVVVMSARPGRIKCDLPVPIEHPRHYSVKTTPVFMDLKARLTEEIRIEVQRAAGANRAAARVDAAQGAMNTIATGLPAVPGNGLPLSGKTPRPGP